MISVNVDGGSGEGTAVYTDIWGKVEKALPVINGTSTGYTVETNTESVEYGYNSKNQLSTILTDSTTYAFTYDYYGNQSAVKAGSNTLASYTYNSNNGKIKKITYGNGFAVEYFYNSLENISEIWYTVNGTASVAYRYTYTESGLLHSVEDVRSGKTTVYNYDKNGRLKLVSEYSTSDMSNDLSTKYEYNDQGELLHVNYRIAYKSGSTYKDKDFYHSYYYDDLKRLSNERISLDSSSTPYANTYYTYDNFHRVSKTQLSYNNGAFVIDNSYAFTEMSSRTSSQVKTYKSTVNGTSTTYTYTYDSKGNITEISIGGAQKYRYVYDNLSQLIREDNVPKNQTYIYTYDTSGNILSKKTYALTASGVTPSGSYTTVSYGYSTGEWGDLLTSYAGSAITYDAIGNPLSYRGKTFTWEGRSLVKSVSGSTTLTFKYNDEGIRTSKTVNGVTTNYYLSGSQIVGEETNGNITVYLYNSMGIIGFQYHASSYAANTWDTYFYEKNLQGDIVAIYNANGTKLVSYTYDAWGNFTTTYYNGASSSNLKNPFTYRSYYYDKDLGLYYLNSRYYDSVTCRFVNADAIGYLGANGDLNSCNLYAYCSNNPIIYSDQNGHFIISLSALLLGVAIGTGIGASISFATTVYQDYCDDGKIFNESINYKEYIGNTVEGAIAGAGVGACTILGAAAGTAIFTGTSATMFVSGGIGITFNTAISIGMGTAFSTGMAGYAANTIINDKRNFDTQTMISAGAKNAFSGALSVFGGYLGGSSGLRIDLATKLLSKKSDVLKRIVVENIFTGVAKTVGNLKGD